jgi:hypothetical protein
MSSAARARTLFFGPARNVIGSQGSIEVIYAAASYGIRISSAEVAIARRSRDGTAETVVGRAER